MNGQLTEYLKRYINISEEENRLFQSYLTPKTVKKKSCLFEEGSVCKYRYFIIKGCFRLFYFDKKGNEQIVHFGIENWWIADYDSLITREPTRLNLQAIEKSEVLELSEDSLAQIYYEIPKIEGLFRQIMERTYIATQRRLEFMFSLSGEELYEVFFGANPQFAQRIPQYMIASYLGFTPEFLSKVRGKKS